MPDLVVGTGDVKEARQKDLSPPYCPPDVLTQFHQVVCDTPSPSETGLAHGEHFLGFTVVF